MYTIQFLLQYKEKFCLCEIIKEKYITIKQLDIIFVIDKLIQQVDQVELFPFKYSGLDRPGNIHILSSSERRTC